MCVPEPHGKRIVPEPNRTVPEPYHTVPYPNRTVSEPYRTVPEPYRTRTVPYPSRTVLEPYRTAIVSYRPLILCDHQVNISTELAKGMFHQSIRYCLTYFGSHFLSSRPTCKSTTCKHASKTRRL